jgi:hypothetical protein
MDIYLIMRQTGMYYETQSQALFYVDDESEAYAFCKKADWEWKLAIKTHERPESDQPYEDIDDEAFAVLEREDARVFAARRALLTIDPTIGVTGDEEPEYWVQKISPYSMRDFA